MHRGSGAGWAGTVEIKSDVEKHTPAPAGGKLTFRGWMGAAQGLSAAGEERLGRKGVLLLLGAVTLAAALKAWLVVTESVPFNADEAVVALMARHILQGARPAFFYGQAYMGSLDAVLVAAGFRMFGEQVWVIRLVQGLLYSGTILTTAWLGRAALGGWRVGLLAAWLLAVPAVNVTLYTTASLGGYGEALLLGNLILLTTLRIATFIKAGADIPAWMWITWGFLAGLGLWAFGLSLVYSIPAGLYLIWAMAKDRKPLTGGFGRAAVLAAGGAILGASPWIGYALLHGPAGLLRELGGGAIAGVGGGSAFVQAARHAFNLIVLGSTAIIGARPPWEVRWLAVPLLPFALALWFSVVIYIAARFRAHQPRRAPAALIAGVMATLVAGFILSPFGADPSGRYYLPLAVPLALFAAEMLARLPAGFPRLAEVAVGLTIAFHLWGTVDSALRNPPGLTTQFDPVARVDHRHMEALMDFLRANGETRGITNYWVSYPLAFLSREQLIFTPRLPYHQDFRYTRRDDRYPPYDELVARANRISYITTHHPGLDAFLRGGLAARDVTWKEARIGDYQIFYHLSEMVLPEELGLGETTP